MTALFLCWRPLDCIEGGKPHDFSYMPSLKGSRSRETLGRHARPGHRFEVGPEPVLKPHDFSYMEDLER
jgi:hypothetical protein